MKTKLKQWTLMALAAALVSSYSMAGTRVNSDGTAEELEWPNPRSTSFNKDRGTFPNLENLKNIRSGVSKDQLYDLIGRPHFSEGFRVREWDYLFHFNTPGQGTEGVTTCQYKILFDSQKYARSFHWKAVDPIGATCPPEVAKTQPPAVIPPAPQRFTLSADALFAFDKGDEANMNDRGKAELDALAAQLRSYPRLDHIRITGHTDLLGSDHYNMLLSQQRAETVRYYLAQRGLPRAIMYAYGAGESQPVKQCVNHGNRTEYIACLQPNRRVEIEVNGVHAGSANGHTGLQFESDGTLLPAQ